MRHVTPPRGPRRVSPSGGSRSGSCVNPRAFRGPPALSGNRGPRCRCGRHRGGAGTAQGRSACRCARDFGDQFDDDRNTLVLGRALLLLSSRARDSESPPSRRRSTFDTDYDTGRTIPHIGMPHDFAAGEAARRSAAGRYPSGTLLSDRGRSRTPGCRYPRSQEAVPSAGWGTHRRHIGRDHRIVLSCRTLTCGV